MPKKKTPIKAFPKSKSDKYERVEEGTLYNKAYATAMEARKAADDEDRQNLKEIRAVEATKGMTHGGEAVTQGAGSAIRGTGFKGVF
jgi:hypothetical protein